MSGLAIPIRADDQFIIVDGVLICALRPEGETGPSNDYQNRIMQACAQVTTQAARAVTTQWPTMTLNSANLQSYIAQTNAGGTRTPARNGTTDAGTPKVTTPLSAAERKRRYAKRQATIEAKRLAAEANAQTANAQANPAQPAAPTNQPKGKTRAAGGGTT